MIVGSKNSATSYRRNSADDENFSREPQRLPHWVAPRCYPDVAAACSVLGKSSDYDGGNTSRAITAS